MNKYIQQMIHSPDITINKLKRFCSVVVVVMWEGREVFVSHLIVIAPSPFAIQKGDLFMDPV